MLSTYYAFFRVVCLQSKNKSSFKSNESLSSINNFLMNIRSNFCFTFLLYDKLFVMDFTLSSFRRYGKYQINGVPLHVTLKCLLSLCRITCVLEHSYKLHALEICEIVLVCQSKFKSS
jgi:hypothetical protein